MAKGDLINIPKRIIDQVDSLIAGGMSSANAINQVYSQIDANVQKAIGADGQQYDIKSQEATGGKQAALGSYGLNDSVYSRLTQGLTQFYSQPRGAVSSAGASVGEDAALGRVYTDLNWKPSPTSGPRDHSLTDQSINPINVNDPNTPADIAYRQRLAAMGNANNPYAAAGAPATPIASQTPQITTDSIQAGLKALTDKIAKEGSTDATGKMLLAPGSVYNPATGTMGAISSSSLKGGTQTGTVTTSTSNSSLADSTAAGAEASVKSIADYIKLLTPPESTSSTKVKDLIEKTTKEMESLEGRGKAQLEAEKAQQVNEKKQILQNYQTELQQKTAEYKAIQAKYQALNTDIEGKPITMNSIIGSQAQVNKVMLAELNSKASEIALIQANVAGAQGNLTLAQDAANRSVDLKYSDAKDAIEIRLKQLELLEGQLSKEEKIRADAITLYLQDQQNQLVVAQSYEKDKNATLLNQMQRYPDAGISLNDTIESANQKITTKSAIYQKESTMSTTQLNSGFTGYSGDDVIAIKNDLEANGLDAVLSGITDPKEVKAIQDIAKDSGVVDKGSRFLNADYFKSVFTTDQLKTAAKDAGFTKGGFLGIGVGERGVNEYIDHLTGLVDQYRLAGYSDQEILKMMQ